MSFKNFQIWRGRLPHWRADDVVYYVTFRHSRPLEESERKLLFVELLKSEGRSLDLLVFCVLPSGTEMLFRVHEAPSGRPLELAKIIESAKRKAGKAIIKKTGERFPPFWEESYDRIVRDEAELEERWMEIVESPVAADLVHSPGQYTSLWIRGEETILDSPPS